MRNTIGMALLGTTLAVATPTVATGCADDAAKIEKLEAEKVQLIEENTRLRVKAATYEGELKGISVATQRVPGANAYPDTSRGIYPGQPGVSPLRRASAEAERTKAEGEAKRDKEAEEFADKSARGDNPALQGVPEVKDDSHLKAPDYLKESGLAREISLTLEYIENPIIDLTAEEKQRLTEIKKILEQINAGKFTHPKLDKIKDENKKRNKILKYAFYTISEARVILGRGKLSKNDYDFFE